MSFKPSVSALGCDIGTLCRIAHDRFNMIIGQKEFICLHVQTVVATPVLS